MNEEDLKLAINALDQTQIKILLRSELSEHVFNHALDRLRRLILTERHIDYIQGRPLGRRAW